MPTPKPVEPCIQCVKKGKARPLPANCRGLCHRCYSRCCNRRHREGTPVEAFWKQLEATGDSLPLQNTGRSRGGSGGGGGWNPDGGSVPRSELEQRIAAAREEKRRKIEARGLTNGQD